MDQSWTQVTRPCLNFKILMLQRKNKKGVKECFKGTFSSFSSSMGSHRSVIIPVVSGMRLKRPRNAWTRCYTFDSFGSTTTATNTVETRLLKPRKQAHAQVTRQSQLQRTILRMSNSQICAIPTVTAPRGKKLKNKTRSTTANIWSYCYNFIYNLS